MALSKSEFYSFCDAKCAFEGGVAARDVGGLRNIAAQAELIPPPEPLGVFNRPEYGGRQESGFRERLYLRGAAKQQAHLLL
jgi:hypothetical protein